MEPLLRSVQIDRDTRVIPALAASSARVTRHLSCHSRASNKRLIPREFPSVWSLDGDVTAEHYRAWSRPLCGAAAYHAISVT